MRGPQHFDLVNRNAVILVHLVEFVDTHHAAVSQNHRASLQIEVALKENHVQHGNLCVLNDACR